MTLRVKCSSLQGTRFFFCNFITVIFGASYLMKLNVIIICFVFSFSMCYLAISFFLSFILLLQFHFIERKIAVTLLQISFSVCQRVIIV